MAYANNQEQAEETHAPYHETSVFSRPNGCGPEVIIRAFAFAAIAFGDFGQGRFRA
jgi:hypothetical protein